MIALDVKSPEFLANPYPTYAALRDEAPVQFSDELEVWVVTGFEDCQSLLRDGRLGHWVEEGNPILYQNPPDHTRVRRLLNSAFVPRVTHFGDRVRELTVDCLDAVEASGSMDIIADLAAPLPIRVIVELLDVPVEDVEMFGGWSADLVEVLAPSGDPVRKQAAGLAAMEARAYLSRFRRERRDAAGEGLLSSLLEAEEAGERLTETEFYSNTTLILAAGHVTTVNLIGNGLLALLRFPDQLERLRRDPTLIRSAVEEMLRFDSPVQMIHRMVLEDFSHGDVSFKKYDMVMCFLGAANRDPVRFERPDELDVGRENNRHVAFATGIHRCLGAPLARLEGEVVFEEILERMPDLSLAEPAPRYKTDYILRGLESLHVSF